MWPQPIAELQEAAGGGDGGCVRGQETLRPSCVDAAPPTLQSRAAVALFTAPAVSTLGSSGMIDASNPLGPALFAAPLYLTPVLLHAGSPLHFLMFSWQKGVTALSFSISNSSTGIPSPPLALFLAMLLKAHFTSHSRMSGFIGRI